MESSSTTSNDDGSIGPALLSVAVAGVLVSVASVPVFGVAKLGSVVFGAVLALANLWALGRLVRGLLGGQRSRASWGPLGLLKLAAVFVVLGVAVRRGWVDVMPFALGFSALPLGIVLSSSKSGTAARGEN